MNHAQCRMARAALDWTIQELATAAGVNYATVVRFEAGKNIHIRSREKLVTAFAAKGAIFSQLEGRVSVSAPETAAGAADRIASPAGLRQRAARDPSRSDDMRDS